MHASKEFRDPYTSFTVRKSPSSFNKIALQADNGNFVSLIGAPPRDVGAQNLKNHLMIGVGLPFTIMVIVLFLLRGMMVDS